MRVSDGTSGVGRTYRRPRAEPERGERPAGVAEAPSRVLIGSTVWKVESPRIFEPTPIETRNAKRIDSNLDKQYAKAKSTNFSVMISEFSR